ncbi:kelch motif-containing protein [Pseudonocardia sp. DR1-2]|uniref:galactose oxidase-like domain-containing protein n=1 Tax=Pseudonocardia sp. DR1-2 TaxID=2951168 RepID=UPI0020443CF8|nr:kelch motif-containing protein [Pseudonocardia sp. DR1-2]MCM3846415.1 kelch motif-containing protein [Pseudonocardia sp. DR1-2]
MRRLLSRAARAVLGRRRLIAMIGVPTVLLAVNAPPALAWISEVRHEAWLHSAEYTAANGRWDVVELPADVRINAIHAAMLPTGKVLLVAGSGNDQKQFDAGTFRTLVYDPATGDATEIDTPSDLFCGGHTFLPDGKLLVAGGTQRYEVLDGFVTRAAGAMRIRNENPDRELHLDAGTVFRDPDGRDYTLTSPAHVMAATKTGEGDGTVVTASETIGFVESTEEGAAGVTDRPAQYAIPSLDPADAANVYGMGDRMTLDKQDFQGIADSYEFDPFAEKYVRVGDMTQKRWYPTLTGLPDGQVLAISGLDGTGQILPGQNEVYDPATKRWTDRPDLFRYFPTYPAIFQTRQEGRLFYSGSNAGYGPADAGRVPGFWNLADNSFAPVPGLREPELMETSGSSWAGPVQDQRMVVVGGGGVGESPVSSARIDTIDLRAPAPAFTPGPDLRTPTRYPSVVQLPTDDLLITGGSADYRGKGASDILQANLYHPGTNTLSAVADPAVGRDYHAEALLLPNGQVLTAGGNSLFKNVDNTKPAPFEQRLEIYTPPYLFHGPQPVIAAAPEEAGLGTTMTVTSPDAARVTQARLIRPSAVTHATDVDQRSVRLDIARGPDGSLRLAVPAEPTLVPPGWYMLFLVDDAGVPSVASWVHLR